MLTAWSTPGFGIAALATGVLGAAGLLLARHLVRAGLAQPVDCPCGAVLCRCGVDLTCAGPAPLLVHAARRCAERGERPPRPRAATGSRRPPTPEERS